MAETVALCAIRVHTDNRMHDVLVRDALEEIEGGDTEVKRSHGRYIDVCKATAHGGSQPYGLVWATAARMNPGMPNSAHKASSISSLNAAG